MRRRLYFVLPDAPSARETMNDLLLARIEERHIHVLAKRGTPLENLHEASFLQKTDVVHGAELGLVVGGVGGALLGILMVLSPPDGISMQLVTILIAALVGSLFGAWASSLIAVGTPNSKLIMFKNDIEEDKILFMVDVPASKVETVRELVEKRHPEAVHGGVEPTIPAFP